MLKEHHFLEQFHPIGVRGLNPPTYVTAIFLWNFPQFKAFISVIYACVIIDHIPFIIEVHFSF